MTIINNVSYYHLRIACTPASLSLLVRHDSTSASYIKTIFNRYDGGISLHLHHFASHRHPPKMSIVFSTLTNTKSYHSRHIPRCFSLHFLYSVAWHRFRHLLIIFELGTKLCTRIFLLVTKLYAFKILVCVLLSCCWCCCCRVFCLSHSLLSISVHLLQCNVHITHQSCVKRTEETIVKTNNA